MLATINRDQMYRFKKNFSVLSDDVRSAVNIKTASIALAIMLFLASIRLQLHTMIQVGKEYQQSNRAVREIPSSQKTPVIIVTSLINSVAEFRNIRP